MNLWIIPKIWLCELREWRELRELSFDMIFGRKMENPVTRMSPECHPKSTHLINPLGASGCPAENMNPYLEPIYSQLPRCLFSCPDPPMLPEGYKQEITFSGLGVHRDDATICNAGVSGWLHQKLLGHKKLVPCDRILAARHCFPKHLNWGASEAHAMQKWVNKP